jgi:hypothetical protein
MNEYYRAADTLDIASGMCCTPDIDVAECYAAPDTLRDYGVGGANIYVITVSDDAHTLALGDTAEDAIDALASVGIDIYSDAERAWEVADRKDVQAAAIAAGYDVLSYTEPSPDYRGSDWETRVILAPSVVLSIAAL